MDDDVLDRRHQMVIDLVWRADYLPTAVPTYLEVGPGTGKLGLALDDALGIVTFLDVDPYLLSAIKAKSEDVEAIEADISTWQADRQWDVVIACEVIEHVGDWRAAVRNMMAAARHRVVMTTPMGNSYYDPGHVHQFAIKDFAWLRQETGWRVNLLATITKEEDIDRNQMCFVVVLDRVYQ